MLKSSQSVVVEELRRSAAAGRVERDQVRAAVPCAQAARHGRDDRLAARRSRPADHRRGSRSMPACPCSACRATRRRPRRSSGVKISGPTPHFLFHLSPQVGSKPDVKAERVGLRHDPVDVIEVAPRSGCAGSSFRERQFAVGVRHVQPVQLGERHRLDDGEALLGAVPEIALGVLAVGAVEQLPRGVAEPEERRARCGDEKAAVLGHSQLRQFVGGPGALGGSQCSRQQSGTRGAVRA